MSEAQFILNEPTPLSPEPKNRSTGALVLFVVVALLMPICLLIYHFVLWFTEQMAIASGSAANLAWAGPIGLGRAGHSPDGHHRRVVALDKR